ncbi:MAG: HAD family hydrolase [Oscillospiraceae bacterium]
MSKSLKDFILVSDLDGTLLGHNGVINERNFKKIDEFKSLGGFFTIATGRTRESLRPYIDKLGINLPAIICNGGAIYDYIKDEYLKVYYVDCKVKEVIKDVNDNFRYIGINVMDKDNIYIVNENEYSKSHIIAENLTYVKCDNLDLLPKEILKVVFTHEDEKLKELETYLENKYKDYSFVRSGEFYYEITPKDINKSVGINFLLENFDIDKTKVFTIGDYYNDVAMLKDATMSGTTQGSNEDIKKVATKTFSKCEDGAVADFISYIINNFGG